MIIIEDKYKVLGIVSLETIPFLISLETIRDDNRS